MKIQTKFGSIITLIFDHNNLSKFRFNNFYWEWRLK